MRRPYEIIVVMRILSSDEDMQAALDQVVNYIEKHNEESVGQITKIDRHTFGRRKLAYEIDGQRDGLYLLIHAEVETEHLTELELNLKLFNPVLRHIIIRDESKPTEAEPEPAE